MVRVTRNLRNWVKLKVLGLTLFSTVGAILSLAGCAGSAENEVPSPTVVQAPVAPPRAATVNYRVKGVIGHLSGQYTDATGMAVPFSGSSSSPTWETTVRIPFDTMRQQPTIFSAQIDTGTPITIEVWMDGQLIGSRQGTQPSLSIKKH